MPKKEPISDVESKELELDIRSKIVRAGLNVSKVADLLNENYSDRKENKQTLNRQINLGILPAWKERRIAKLLGYSVIWVKAEKH